MSAPKKLAAYWDWPSGAVVPDARIVVCAPDWGDQPIGEQCDGNAMKVIRAARDGQILVFPATVRLCVPWPLLSAWPAREGVIYIPALHVARQADLARLPDLLAVMAERRAFVVSPEEAIDLNPLVCEEHGEAEIVNGDDGATPFCAKCPSGEEATEMGSAGYLDDIDVVFIVGVDEPMHPEWVRRVVDQCRAAGVPCVLVTWGDYIPADQATEDDVERDDIVHIARDSDWVKYFRGPSRSGAMLDGEAVEDLPAWLGGEHG